MYRIGSRLAVLRAYRWYSSDRVRGILSRRLSMKAISISSEFGLQRRIMLYAVIGFALLFGGYFALGMHTVNRSTEMVFSERLTIAQSVAASLGQEFGHAVSDATEEMDSLTASSDQLSIDSAVRDTFSHLSKVDRFSLFEIERVNLIHKNGELISTAPSWPVGMSSKTPPPLPELDFASSLMQFVWVESAPGVGLLFVSQPIGDEDDTRWASLVLEVSPVQSSESFFPFGVGNPIITAKPSVIRQPPPNPAEYHLELVSADGLTVGGFGSDERPGQKSIHYPIVAPLVEDRSTSVMLHEVVSGSAYLNHVVAVVPVPQTDLYLVLEQDVDIALALPNEFRRNLTLYGVMGFVGVMIATWVTTRSVVQPTERLTQATVRMAQGELAVPIETQGRDEIGVLATNLELMRRQLSDALERVSTANRELESQVIERTRRLRELVRRVLTAHEEERNRVALELHDETSQIASAITFTLDSIVRKENGLNAEDREKLYEVKDLSGSLLAGIRRLIAALRPSALINIGLSSALRSHAEDLFRSTGVEIHVVDDTGGLQIPDYKELVFYRVCQEGLNNVAKHSDCDDVWIELSSVDRKVFASVRDNGIGFDIQSVLSSEGFGIGITGMRERAALIDGEVEIHSKLGEGTIVKIKASIDGDKESAG